MSEVILKLIFEHGFFTEENYHLIIKLNKNLYEYGKLRHIEKKLESFSVYCLHFYDGISKLFLLKNSLRQSKAKSYVEQCKIWSRLLNSRDMYQGFYFYTDEKIEDFIIQKDNQHIYFGPVPQNLLPELIVDKEAYGVFDKVYQKNSQLFRINEYNNRNDTPLIYNSREYFFQMCFFFSQGYSTTLERDIRLRKQILEDKNVDKNLKKEIVENLDERISDWISDWIDCYRSD